MITMPCTGRVIATGDGHVTHGLTEFNRIHEVPC